MTHQTQTQTEDTILPSPSSPPSLPFPTDYKPDAEREGHEYNLPSADSKGHSDQIKFLAPQGQVAPRVKALVQGGKLGYRSDGDFYRRAVKLLLLVDEAETGVNPAVGYQIQLLDEINQMAERNKLTRDNVTALTAHVQECLESGEVEEAGELMAKALAVVEAAHEGPWKRRVMEEFQERFKVLMGERGEE